jgi:hypothetical protein
VLRLYRAAFLESDRTEELLFSSLRGGQVHTQCGLQPALYLLLRCVRCLHEFAVCPNDVLFDLSRKKEQRVTDLP